MTTQIGAVVVSTFGIFVVEAKNFDGDGSKGGWVFGDMDSEEPSQECRCIWRVGRVQDRNATGRGLRDETRVLYPAIWRALHIGETGC